ncbi:MAG: GNAT family protein [Pseudomonadota bacterium]
MLRRRGRLAIETDRLILRPPRMSDYVPWATVLRESEAFLKPWEPVRPPDHISRRAFRGRVAWADRAIEQGRALPLFLHRRSDERLLGGVTLDHIRRGPAQAGTLGYWIGVSDTRQGFMREAVEGVVAYAFSEMGLSRIEAACLPENVASRGLLEGLGFVEEGEASGYLQIAGTWRAHVLYARLRSDRKSATA